MSRILVSVKIGSLIKSIKLGFFRKTYLPERFATRCGEEKRVWGCLKQMTLTYPSDLL